VHNEQEIKSDLVKPTGLWQRAEYFKNNYSPFGLIIVNNKESDQLFENAYRYQPEYFQSGMAFDILQNSIQPIYRGLAECLSEEKRTRNPSK
jgi:hypothetical protein